VSVKDGSVELMYPAFFKKTLA